MAINLIVENGTRPSGANTYVSFDDAQDFIEMYNQNAANYASLTVDTFTVPLIRAAKVMDDLYGSTYCGVLYSDTQSLLFPRGSFYDNNGRFRESLAIPKELQHAQVELALLIYDGKDPYVEKSTESNVLSKSVEISGAIKTTTTFDKPVEDEKYAGYRTIERILSPILVKKSKSLRLVL